MYYEIDSHLESDYEDKNGNNVDYDEWEERKFFLEDEYDSPEWENDDDDDETDNEDDPDMYPKDIERDQLDYPHNMPLEY